MNRRHLLAGAAMLLGCSKSGLAATLTRFVVSVVGQGPDVILIPGLTCGGDVWDETVARLPRIHRCHVVTVAGFAGAPAGPNAAGPLVEPLAAELAGYIESEKLRKPAIIGHSIGGFTGLVLASRRPDLIGRLLIVDALSFYSLLYGPTATVVTARPFAEQQKAGILAQPQADFEASLPAQADYFTFAADRRANLIRWSKTSDRRVVAQGMYDVMTMDMRPNLPAMTTPVTVLYAASPRGDRPEAADARNKAAYGALPGVKLRRIDDSRHFIMYDQPDVFAREVDAFLR